MNHKVVHFVPWRMHHGYLGILMIVYGFTGIRDNLTEIPAITVMVIGGLIFIDDVIEHTVTTNTPLRIFYDRVVYPLLRKISH